MREPTINRPGLALSGFYKYFAGKRVQVIGSAEMCYLKSLDTATRRQRFGELCAKKVPCIVVSRSGTLPRELIRVAADAGVSVFKTPMVTMRFINAATLALESDFAPTMSKHGSMMDIMGIGTLICGSSGIGKSECVLGLIERGYSLVSDDITRFRLLEGRDLIGTSPPLTRTHMEVRGIGIINVSAIFGVGSIRLDKRLDLVVTLMDWHELDEVDRIGLEKESVEILGISVPHVTIPVRVGRDIGRLVEVAALDQKLKTFGHDSAVQFNQRLLDQMAKTS